MMKIDCKFILIIFFYVVPLISLTQNVKEDLKSVNPFFSKSIKDIISAKPDNMKFNSSIVAYCPFKKDQFWLMECLPTAVHEHLHSLNFYYTNQINYSNRKTNVNSLKNKCYFINKDSIIKVEVPEQVFNSNKAKSFITQKGIDLNTRYKSYYGDSSSLSSQVDGIYGLLEEFLAYYISLETLANTYEYYEATKKLKKRENFEKFFFFSSFQSDILAYFEFKMMIAWYLNHIEKYDNNLYNKIMIDEKLKLFYKNLDDTFYNKINWFKEILRESLVKKNKFYELISNKNIKIKNKRDHTLIENPLYRIYLLEDFFKNDIDINNLKRLRGEEI